MTSNHKKKRNKSNDLKEKISEIEIFFRDQIKTMTYEDSLMELDSLLEKLQNDSISLEELQTAYIKAKIYLEHCENLLKKVEQDVLTFDLEDE